MIIKNGLRIDLEREYYDMIESMIIKYNQSWMRMVRYSQAIVVGMKYLLPRVNRSSLLTEDKILCLPVIFSLLS